MSQNDTAAIQQAMHHAFPAHEERVADFYAMMAYHLGWRDAALAPTQANPGKLVRPQLCLLACRAAGGTAAAALPAAAALQLIHDFSLIHDDIEDNSTLRRNRPTVWSIWGLAQGINVGDGMFALAHLTLGQLADGDLPAERVVAAMRCFDRAILTICEGQYLDIANEGLLTVSVDDYLAMIARKTAALLGACCEIGAIVAGADAATSTALATFGRSLGLAFQVQDDLLGVWGEPERTGKPFAADLYRRKVSLPLIYALAHAEVGSEVAGLYASDPDDGAVERLLALLDTAGARDATAAMAARFHHESLAALDQVRGDAEALGSLRSIAQGLLGRQA